MAHTTGQDGPSGTPLAVTVSLALAVAAVTAACSNTAPAPMTLRLERGHVSTRVSASGALAAVSTQNLGFAHGGVRLVELDVKVGDTVRAGQVLAREDPFSFRQLLNQQQAQLNQQQAILDRLVRSPVISGNRDSLDQAKMILNATKAKADALHNKDQSAVFRARQAVDQARGPYEQARQKYISDGCGTPPDIAAATPGRTTTSGSSTSTSPFGGLTSMATCSNTTRQTDLQTLNAAMGNLLTTKTNLDSAQRTLDVDDTQSQISIEIARNQGPNPSQPNGVLSAQNRLDQNSSDKAPNIAAQAALVANGRALVANAQRDLDNTVLYAPVAGTISSITGTVGEYVGQGGGTSALAPGSDAAIPGVGAAATADQSSASASGAPSATRPGGSAFIVLNNINTFQVVVPLEESDAAKVAPNLKVQITFDALPDLSRDGMVLSVAPGGVDISGVTNYYATILLTDTDPRLKTGQTADAGVLVSELDNVLVVPNPAVLKQGGRSFVSTPGKDGNPVQVPFQPGLVGDDNTQVLSGLNEGQEIQFPQAQVSANPTGGGEGHGGG